MRQIDHSRPQPAQKFAPPAFCCWLEKQRHLAERVVVCYDAGCFGYEPARHTQGRLRAQLRRQIQRMQAMGRSLLLQREMAVSGCWWRGTTWVQIVQGMPPWVVGQLEIWKKLIELTEKEALEIARWDRVPSEEKKRKRPKNPNSHIPRQTFPTAPPIASRSRGVRGAVRKASQIRRNRYHKALGHRVGGPVHSSQRGCSRDDQYREGQTFSGGAGRFRIRGRN
ncbi:MAG: hypothetical protein WBW78_16370 [Terrimicrobiaceae bacterium]